MSQCTCIIQQLTAACWKVEFDTQYAPSLMELKNEYIMWFAYPSKLVGTVQVAFQFVEASSPQVS